MPSVRKSMHQPAFFLESVFARQKITVPKCRIDAIWNSRAICYFETHKNFAFSFPVRRHSSRLFSTSRQIQQPASVTPVVEVHTSQPSNEPELLQFEEVLPVVQQGDSFVQEPCILLHGLLGCRRNLRTLASKLTCFKRCILVDLRNHGSSPHSSNCSFEAMAEDMKNLICNSLNISQAHIIGHSLGGRVAMATALAYPELVCGLGVLDMAPPRTHVTLSSQDAIVSKSNQHESRGELQRILGLLHMTPLHTMSTRAEVENWLAEHYDGSKPLSQATIQFLSQNVKINNSQLSWIPNIPVLMESFNKQLVNWPFEANLHQWNNGPVIFVKGNRSRWVELEDHTAIKTFFPQAIIKEVVAGHWLHAENPDAVAHEIKLHWSIKTGK